MTMTDPISPAQANFIASLLKQRLTTLGFATVEDAERALNLDQQTKGTASVLIERLKGMPADPDPTMPDVVARATRKGTGNRSGTCATCGHLVSQGAGFYFLLDTGKWAVHHKVGECSSAPAPAPVQVEEGLYMAQDGTVVLVYRTRNGRLAGKTKQGHSFKYEMGAVHLAATGHKVTAEEAATFGLTHGHCIACAHDLTDDRSLSVGYGPVCAKKYGWPWGDVLANACSPGQQCHHDTLCSKHSAEYQRKYGRAANE